MAGTFNAPTETLAIRVIAADGATGGNVDFDFTTTRTLQVVDAVLIKTAANGAAAHTVQILSTAAAISDAMSLNIVDTTVARPAVLTDANARIAIGGTLRLALVDGGAGNTAFDGYVLCTG